MRSICRDILSHLMCIIFKPFQIIQFFLLLHIFLNPSFQLNSYQNSVKAKIKYLYSYPEEISGLTDKYVLDHCHGKTFRFIRYFQVDIQYFSIIIFLQLYQVYYSFLQRNTHKALFSPLPNVLLYRHCVYWFERLILTSPNKFLAFMSKKFEFCFI